MRRDLALPLSEEADSRCLFVEQQKINGNISDFVTPCTKRSRMTRVGLGHCCVLAPAYSVNGFSNFLRLRVLKLVNNKGLREVDLQKVPRTLESLEVIGIEAEAPVKVEGFDHRVLRWISLKKCAINWKDVEGCTNVRVLRLSEIRELGEMRFGKSAYGKLEDLAVGGCERLQTIVGLGNLRALRRLQIRECPRLESILDLELDGAHVPSDTTNSMLPALQSVSILHCRSLREVHGLEGTSDFPLCLLLQQHSSTDIAKVLWIHVLRKETVILARAVWEESKLEFVFSSAQSMCEIVGVGVAHGKVIVQHESGRFQVVIDALEARDWENIWKSENYSAIFYHSPIPAKPHHEKPMSMTEAASTIGVGIDGGQEYIHRCQLPKDQEFPPMWGVVKLFLENEGNKLGQNDGDDAARSQAHHDPHNNIASTSAQASQLEPSFQAHATAIEAVAINSNMQTGIHNGNGLNALAFRRVTVKLPPRKRQLSRMSTPIDDDHVPLSLRNVSLIPTLEFHFVGLNTNERQIKMRMNVVCALSKEAAPQSEHIARFGWYHNNISVSMECNDAHSTRLEDAHNENDSGETGKETMRNTTTCSSQLGMAGSLTAHAGIAGITAGLIASRASTNAHEETSEVALVQGRGGFTFRNFSADAKMCFVAEQINPAIPDDVDFVRSRDRRRAFLGLDMCQTFVMKTASTWTCLDTKNATYTFTTHRDLVEKALQKVPTSKHRWTFFPHRRSHSTTNESMRTDEIMQSYNQVFLLNHAMTNFDGKEYITLVRNTHEVLEVGIS